MKLIDFLYRKIFSCASSREKSDGQGLALYRQLRTAENKLFKVRDCLDRALENHRKSVAEHTTLAQQRDEVERGVAAEAKDHGEGGMQESQLSVLRQQESARKNKELQKEIELLESDQKRLEAEYLSVQMKVRTYFYFEACQGRLSEPEAAAGQVL